MDRNPLSDLEAIAASPGLEQLAGVIAQYLNPQNPDISYSLSLLMLLAGRWTFRSANACESAMRTTNLCRDLRESALSVGRRLPEDLPSLSELHTARRSLDATFAADPTGVRRHQFFEDLSLAFSQVAVEVAKSVDCPPVSEARPGTTRHRVARSTATARSSSLLRRDRRFRDRDGEELSSYGEAASGCHGLQGQAGFRGRRCTHHCGRGPRPRALAASSSRNRPVRRPQRDRLVGEVVPTGHRARPWRGHPRRLRPAGVRDAPASIDEDGRHPRGADARGRPAVRVPHPALRTPVFGLRLAGHAREA